MVKKKFELLMKLMRI